MINGTISGQLIDKERLTPTEQAPYCALLVVQVRTWVTGKEVTQEVECYFPKWMEKRLDFFFKNDVKRVTVAYDHVSVSRTIDESGRSCLCLNAVNVY